MRSPQLLELKVNEFKRGERPDGNAIGYYRPLYGIYSRNKHAQNPLAGLGRVDLIDTGSFTRQLFVEERGKGLFQFDSYDDKAPELFEKYDYIRGLQADTFITWENNYLRPEINKYIIQRLK